MKTARLPIPWYSKTSEVYHDDPDCHTAANLSLVKWMIGTVLAGAWLTVAVLQFLA